ncbi:MAG: hypothetical protein QOK29_1065 [Rhodospirillaceae bacterium]|nr:hypothetical protein [Rhodospirillaceae bacterium]
MPTKLVAGMAGIRRRRVIRILLLTAVALPLCGFGSIESLLAPGKDLWRRWTANDSASTARIDHDAWTVFLRKYLVAGEVNRLRYDAVTAADRHALDSYIARLTATPISRYNRSEQLAYWINLYNALTIDLVLQHYPIGSIRDIDISPGWFTVGPWDKDLVTVEGAAVSLNDIEHRILRPIWNDPRLHYALNCAALGCPNLQPLAFTADNADRLMEQAAHDFINSRAFRVKDGRLVVSSIYAWFSEDFGGGEAGVLAHLRRYAAPPVAAELAPFRNIGGDEYDWRLNDPGGQ